MVSFFFYLNNEIQKIKKCQQNRFQFIASKTIQIMKITIQRFKRYDLKNKGKYKPRKNECEF